MKITLQYAVIILVAGMILVLLGVVLQTEKEQLSNPTILSGLIVEFLGTIWLVLSLSQRRKKEDQ